MIEQILQRNLWKLFEGGDVNVFPKNVPTNDQTFFRIKSFSNE